MAPLMLQRSENKEPKLRSDIYGMVEEAPGALYTEWGIGHIQDQGQADQDQLKSCFPEL